MSVVREFRRGGSTAALLLLLLLFAARLTHTAIEKSLTVDEPHYIGTGLYLWDSGDYHFATSLNLQPPLAYHLASVPLLLLDLDGLVPDRRVSRSLRMRNSPSAATIRIVSRLPFVALSVWGALLVFGWAKEVSGDLAGLLAVFLYTFSPMMLAHGALAHSDITATVFYLQALYALWRWTLKPTPLRALVCGISLGLGLIAKSTGVLLFAGVGLLFAAFATRPARATRTQPWIGPDAWPARVAWLARAGGAMLAFAVCVFWLGYGGSFDLTTVEEGRLPNVALPGYVQALLLDTVINAGGRVAYLLGEFSNRGWWYYFPVALALKAPVATVAMLLAAIASLVRRRGRLGLFLGVPAALYGAMAMFWLDIPLGLRYVLSLFPLAFVFIGTQLVPVAGVAARTALVVGCVWVAVSSASVHPHYLAYFNEFAGGPNSGPEYLLDSNIDWGQDLSTLAHYLDEQGNPPVSLAYFGSESPERYGIRSQRLAGCRPTAGWVAISVNVMEGLYSARNPFARPKPGCYDWLRKYQPVATPGHSIRVYRVPSS